MQRGSRSTQDFGARLRLRRESMGLTQGEVAARAGVTRQLVSRIEHGHPRAEFGGVIAVVRALDAALLLSDSPQHDAVDIDSYFGG
ncbi:MAG: helix-turn-helix domain-containing protein [Micropruina sp.]|uniref:helix-turn-helix domain-containing protein n=1 Tax=Micropruina sp. TaxID=2737536 RepID=UPI0039E6744F